jgi:trehalose 6-phosphate phosphatase
MMNSAAGHGLPTQGGLPHGFWDKVRGARRHLLMLAYDGTLVPFQPHPGEAMLPREARERLRRIALSPPTRLVVFSGRRMAEMEALLAGIPAHLVGEHGWDERTLDGQVILHPLPGEAATVLGQAVRAARDCGLGEYLERKRCSITLHTRTLKSLQAARIESECRRLWSAAFQRRGVALNRIDGGIELRAIGTHEGTAVAKLLAGADSGTLPVYVGDDRSDEVAFYELLGQGDAIRVGVQPRESLAPYHLADSADVMAFLDRWLETTRTHA